MVITLPSLSFVIDWIWRSELKENGPFNNFGRMLLRIKTINIGNRINNDKAAPFCHWIHLHLLPRLARPDGAARSSRGGVERLTPTVTRCLMDIYFLILFLSRVSSVH